MKPGANNTKSKGQNEWSKTKVIDDNNKGKWMKYSF